MTNKKYYLTKEGIEKLKDEHEELRKQLKKKLKEEAPGVFRSDDINPEYITFRKDLSVLEEKISKLEEVLRNAEIVKNNSKTRKDADIGARIIVESEGYEDEFILVGTMEADPAMGKISVESPVGKALMGSKEGEEVVIPSNKKVVYKIKKIS